MHIICCHFITLFSQSIISRLRLVSYTSWQVYLMLKIFCYFFPIGTSTWNTVHYFETELSCPYSPDFLLGAAAGELRLWPVLGLEQLQHRVQKGVHPHALAGPEPSWIHGLLPKGQVLGQLPGWIPRPNCRCWVHRPKNYSVEVLERPPCPDPKHGCDHGIQKTIRHQARRVVQHGLSGGPGFVVLVALTLHHLWINMNTVEKKRKENIPGTQGASASQAPSFIVVFMAVLCYSSRGNNSGGTGCNCIAVSE